MKNQKKDKDTKKRASFGHASKGRGMLKSQKTGHEEGANVATASDPPPIDTYRGYDISMLPLQARPDPSRDNRGAHSYTLGNAAGDATIEVLLKHGAYFIKKVSDRGTGGKGQISMKTHGAAEAWDLAKARAGF